MSLINPDGSPVSHVTSIKLKPGMQVESYGWVPKDMVIMISSRDVTIMHGMKKAVLSHKDFVEFRKQLQSKLVAMVKEGETSGEKKDEFASEDPQQEEKERTQAAEEERAEAPH
jgi:hypothetical protein